MRVQITPDRLLKIKALLKEWEQKKVCTLIELQSLLGKLNFAASTVHAGHVFLSWIINKVKACSPKHKKRVSTALRKDINWWSNFMDKFDGITIMPPECWNTPDSVFATDSCLTRCGRWADDKVFTAPFPEWVMQKEDVHINEKELLAFVIALKIWTDKARNKNILAYCDNQTRVEIVNSGAAWNVFAQACLREIVYLAAKANAMIKLIFRLTAKNGLADSLSRWDKPEAKLKFKELTKGRKVKFVRVPSHTFAFSHGW